MTWRKLVTVHAPLDRALAMRIFEVVQVELRKAGIFRSTLSPEHLPDIVMVGDVDVFDEDDDDD